MKLNNLFHILIASSASLFLPCLLYAEAIAVTAYGRKADLTMVEKLLVNKNFEEVISKMKEKNVAIYRVDVVSPESANVAFKYLEMAPVSKLPELAEKIKEINSEAALFISKNDISGADSNIILVANDADPITVFHEFSHHLFEIQNHQDTEKITSEQKQNDIFLRNYNFKTRKVMFDRELLLSKHWRDDIKKLNEEYISSIDSAQGLIGSEEVVIETTLLKLLVQTNSPYMNVERVKNGINRYCLGLINLSEGLIHNVLALNDVIVTDGMDLDPKTKIDERIDWTTRREKMQKIVDSYLIGPLAFMKSQVEASQKIIEKLP